MIYLFALMLNTKIGDVLRQRASSYHLARLHMMTPMDFYTIFWCYSSLFLEDNRAEHFKDVSLVLSKAAIYIQL